MNSHSVRFFSVLKWMLIELVPKMEKQKGSKTLNILEWSVKNCTRKKKVESLTDVEIHG